MASLRNKIEFRLIRIQMEMQDMAKGATNSEQIVVANIINDINQIITERVAALPTSKDMRQAKAERMKRLEREGDGAQGIF